MTSDYCKTRIIKHRFKHKLLVVTNLHFQVVFCAIFWDAILELFLEYFFSLFLDFLSPLMLLLLEMTSVQLQAQAGGHVLRQRGTTFSNVRKYVRLVDNFSSLSLFFKNFLSFIFHILMIYCVLIEKIDNHPDFHSFYLLAFFI